MVSKKDKNLSSSSKDVKSSTTTTSTTSKTTKSTSAQSTAQSSSTQKANVVISEVYDSTSGSIDDKTLKVMQSQYVVTQPENQTHKSKEHYIYGGTQIVEVGTTLGSEMSREKNQSSWDGKFVYEGTPERTVLKSWTKKETVTEPATSATKNTSSTISTHDMTTESSKLVSDTLKQQAHDSVTKSSTADSKTIKSDGKTNVDNASNSKVTTTRTTSNWDGTFAKEKDSTDAASATDLLLESERCIAKKAYVTTTKADDQNTSSTSTRTNIESQILSDQRIDSDRYGQHSTETTKTTASGGRYPISTIKTHPSRGPDSKVTTLTKAGDISSDFTTEEYSQSFSSSSRMAKESSSSKVIEIVDGKEKIVSDSYNESGSMQSKVNQEELKSKYGGGVVPKVEYDQKTAEETIKFSGDRRDKEPIYDRDYRDSHRNIKQIGDNAPVEYLQGSYETTRFDDKTKKYITDVRHHENNRQLDSHKRIKDSVHSKYDTETARLSVDNRNTNARTNNQITDIYRNDYKTATNTNFDDVTNSRNDYSKTISSNDVLNKTTESKFVDSTTATYTSKVFDNKSNTWKTVDEHNVSEYNVRSTSPTRRRPSGPDYDRSSPTKNIDLKPINDTKLFTDKKSTTDKNSFTDIRSTIDTKKISDTKSTVDRTSRTDTTKSITKTTDQKVSQQLYDEKTKTWREVDEKTIKSKRPSLIRYISKDNDGKYTTIYKRKLFDRRSGTWKVVDEKVYKNNNFNEHIPEVIEDVTNVTTTTYTTKVFDAKTNTWKIVDEQTYTDRNTQVPKDIADEIARDQPDIANITTTTELTKVSKNRFSKLNLHVNFGKMHFFPFLPQLYKFDCIVVAADLPFRYYDLCANVICMCVMRLQEAVNHH